ncbi:sialidase [Haloarculaceae archaeon H-GB11]|nr:sialidase [Haloarculaceae archaeon H-GB11]
MQYTRALALTVAVLLVVPGLSVAGAQGNPNLSASFADNRVTPGEETTLTVNVVNDGEVDTIDSNIDATYATVRSRLTTARGVTVSMGEADAPIDVETNSQTFGSLQDGASAPAKFDVTVSENAKPGTYEVPVHVEYTSTTYISAVDGNHKQRTVNRTYDLTLRVRDAARFEVVDVESNARVGATGTVTLEMKNVGTDPANDTQVTLTSKNSDLTFGTSSSASRYVGSWEQGETRDVEYRISATPSASAQQYAFEVATTFETSDGETMTGETQALSVVPRAEQQFVLVGTESNVAVDDTGTLNVTLRNDGPISVRDATVTISSENSDITFGKSASSSRYVGSWEAGETRSVQLETTASGDAEPNNYALNAQISYEDEEGDQETATGLSLGLRPEPEREFVASDLSSTLRVGEEGTLKGTITNTGDTTADSVAVVLDTNTQNINPSKPSPQSATSNPASPRTSSSRSRSATPPRLARGSSRSTRSTATARTRLDGVTTSSRDRTSRRRRTNSRWRRATRPSRRVRRASSPSTSRTPATRR